MNRTHYQHVSSKKDALDVTDGEIQKEHFRDPDGSGEPSSLPHTRALALLSVSWPRGLRAGLTVVSVGSRGRAPLIPDRHWLGRASELPRHGFGPKVDGPEFK